MSSNFDRVVADFYRASQHAALDGLREFLRIPSISALPEHAQDTRRAAEFVRAELDRIGLNRSRLIEGDGHPLVAAEWLGAAGKPTLLVYGHYDIQPPDPIDEWHSPPFEPTIRGDDLFARGAADDKGQLWLIIKAIEGFLKTGDRLPISIRVLVEGEEETSGSVIADFVSTNVAELKCDAVLICDTEMFAPDLPTLCVGLRGIVYTEIVMRGAHSDLHSGTFGGAAPNPLVGLAHVIAGLKSPDGRVLIPGFYDDVVPPSARELEAWRSLPFDPSAYLRNEVGSSELVGEPGFSLRERLWARPTLDVHGIRGGFVGDGAKTVIPARASAKVSMRIVPEMDPATTFERFQEAVAGLTPPGLQSEVGALALSSASVVDTNNRFIQEAVAALTEVFGQPTVFTREGGSIPVVSLFQRQLGVPIVLMGFGLPDDNLHAPNEKFHLPNFYRGIEAVGRFLARLGTS